MLGDVRLRDAQLPEPGRGVARSGPDQHRLERRAGRLGVAAGEGRGLAREVVDLAAAGRLDEDEDAGHDRTPMRPQQLDDRRRRVRAAAQHLGLRSLVLGHHEAHLLDALRAPLRRPRLDRLLLRPQAARHRRVARQVEPLLHGHDGRERDAVDVTAARHLLLAAQAAVLERDGLHARHARPAQGMRHPDPDLVVAGVGRLVAEEDDVVLGARLPLGRDRVDDRGGRRLPVELVVGQQVDRAVDAERHAVAQLLLGLGRAERQHGRGSAARLDQAHGLLHPALLVRADREPQVAGVDRLLVGRQHDRARRSSGRASRSTRMLSATRSGSACSRDRRSASAPAIATVTG